MKWKKQKPIEPVKILQPQSQPTKYPSGLAVETPKATYLIKNKFKMRFYSDRAFKSWKLPVSLANEVALKDFIDGGFVGFRDGSLLKDISDNKLYLISNNSSRHIVTPDVFDKYGLSKDDIIEVSNKEILLHKVGEDLE